MPPWSCDESFDFAGKVVTQKSPVSSQTVSGSATGSHETLEVHRPVVRFGWRLRIGMLLPSSNSVAEPEIPATLPEGVSLHTTRLKLTGSSREELLAMASPSFTMSASN